MNDWPFENPPNTACLTVRAVVEEGSPILLVCRDADDGGFQFLTGENADMAQALLVSLGSLLKRDATLRFLADLQPGWMAKRAAVNEPWLRKMKTQMICPACSTPNMERSVHGGLFTDRCTTCGREVSGTYSPTVTEFSPSTVRRMWVRWEQEDVVSHALKILREASPLARSMSLTELSKKVCGGNHFDLGVLAEHRRLELTRQLEQAGFLVTIEDAP